MNIIAFVKMKIYLCETLKAIHNKDYSVVKTFKTGPSWASSSFILAKAQQGKPNRNYESGGKSWSIVSLFSLRMLLIWRLEAL